MLERDSLYCLDALQGFHQLDDESIDVIITSPPYWQARDYGFVSDFGLEKSPLEYVAKYGPLFDEALRVLKPTGSFWLNIGDCRSQGKRRQRGRRDTLDTNKGANFPGWKNWDGDLAFIDVDMPVPAKSFIGIPERIMLSAIDHGFIIRDKIIWAKAIQFPDGDSFGGTTPSPILDRYLTAWEYVFYMTKQRHSYFNHVEARIPAKGKSKDGKKMGANVWVIQPSRARESFMKDVERPNFATYPVELTDIIIKAACPPYTCSKCGKPTIMLPNFKAFKSCTHMKVWPVLYQPGLVLDPFIGSGTTAISAIKYGVDCIGFDASEEQIVYANERIHRYVQQK